MKQQCYVSQLSEPYGQHYAISNNYISKLDQSSAQLISIANSKTNE